MEINSIQYHYSWKSLIILLLYKVIDLSHNTINLEVHCLTISQVIILPLLRTPQPLVITVARLPRG